VDMGVIDYADVNPDDLSAADEQIADELEGRHALVGSVPAQTNGHGGLSDVDPERALEVEATIEAGRTVQAGPASGAGRGESAGRR
jgi:hypothetical protein